MQQISAALASSASLDTSTIDRDGQALARLLALRRQIQDHCRQRRHQDQVDRAHSAQIFAGERDRRQRRRYAEMFDARQPREQLLKPRGHRRKDQHRSRDPDDVYAAKSAPRHSRRDRAVLAEARDRLARGDEQPCKRAHQYPGKYGRQHPEVAEKDDYLATGREARADDRPDKYAYRFQYV